MDLRGWEFYRLTGLPVIGATVTVYEAAVDTPVTVVASGVTDQNGQWSFTGLTNTAKDVKVVFVGEVRWYKGLTRHVLDKLTVTTEFRIPTGAGSGKVLTSDANGIASWATPAPSGYSTVQEDGSGLTQRPTLNFTGAGITCVDDAGNTRTNCAVPGVAFPLLAPDGTAGAASYAFSNDAGLGLFRAADDVLGLAAGGAERARITTAGLRVTGDGSAGTPAYSFVNDTDVGLYREGANLLSAAVNGVRGWLLNTTGLRIDGTLSIGADPTTNTFNIGGSRTDGSIVSIFPTYNLGSNDQRILNIGANIIPTAAIGGTTYFVDFSPWLTGTEGVTTNTISTLRMFNVRLQNIFGNYDANVGTIINFGSQAPTWSGAAGTISNFYGYHTDVNSSQAGITTSWAFYGAGTATSYFGGEVEIDGALNHDGSTVGLFGVTPATRPPAYTITNGTIDRTFDANASSTAELADLIFTMWTDLKSLGILQ